MEKKMYLPTEEDLYEIDRIKNIDSQVKINAYGYLILKAIEKILIDRANGMPYENMDDYILSIPEIIHGICWVYPEDIKKIKKAKQSGDLCYALLDKETDSSIYKLDTIGMFDLENSQFIDYIVEKTISILNEKIGNNPEYRFDYQQSDILDSIFNVEYQKYVNLPFNLYTKLINIDASYALYYDARMQYNDLHLENTDEQLITHRKRIFFAAGLNRMFDRYNFSPYIGYDYQELDITKTNDERVKRLTKFLSK